MELLFALLKNNVLGRQSSNSREGLTIAAISGIDTTNHRFAASAALAN